MKRDQVLDVMAQSIRELITNADQSWRKEWGADGYRQQNFKATEYRNENQIILFNQAVKNGYKDPRWMTFNQINENGFKLEKGSKASPILFYSRTDKKLERDDNGRPKLDAEGNKVYNEHLRDKPVFVSYNVFNATKINGIEPFTLKKNDSPSLDENLKSPDAIVLLEAVRIQEEERKDKSLNDAARIFQISPQLFKDETFMQNLLTDFGDNSTPYHVVHDHSDEIAIERNFLFDNNPEDPASVITYLYPLTSKSAHEITEILNANSPENLHSSIQELMEERTKEELQIATVLDAFPDLDAKFIRYGLSDGGKLDFGLSQGDYGVTPRYLSLEIAGNENEYVLVKDASNISNEKASEAINALRNLDDSGLNQLVRAYDDKYLSQNREAVNLAGEQFKTIMGNAKDIGTAAKINLDHAPDNFNGFSLVTNPETERTSIRFSEPNGNNNIPLLTGLNEYWTQDVFNKINEIDRAHLAGYFFEQNTIQKENLSTEKALTPSQIAEIQQDKVSEEKPLSPSQLLAIRNAQAFTVHTGVEGEQEVRRNTGDLIATFPALGTADSVALQLNDFINKSPDERQATIAELQAGLAGYDKYAIIERDVKDYCERAGIELREISSEGAFYSNGHTDKVVVMPLKEQFGDNQDAYYATLMHELVHSTKVVEGTRKVLETDSPLGNNFGSQNYAREELVAEVGSLLLCNHYGLNSYADPKNEKLSELTQNSAAYLKNWFEGGKLVDADIVNAVSEAKRASNLITGDSIKIAAKISQAEKPEIAEKTAIKI